MRELTSLRGTKLNTPEAIKKEVVEFYKALMGSSTTSLPVVDRNTMKKGPTITYEQGVALCEDVMDEEIWKALTSIGDDKAPGVDGYNTYFYKKTWSITKDDMLKAIKEPIACCTIIYKVIAKVLATRMQKIMAHIISEAESGFIPGRKIDDNIVLATELVKTYSRQHISPRCMLKIDLQKAYDSVEWIFLEQVPKNLCFPQKFIQWIMECVHTVNYTIMVNGETTPPFNAARGLRQGDPISPYLFDISMEYLSRCLAEMTSYSLVEGIKNL
ncbi:hypothetical protein KY285_016102 [Solanum tuberosum]|nr:hypothetical protein KY285_016102 [Solanum tuberosum]